MKKTISALCALLLFFSISACTNNNDHFSDIAGVPFPQENSEEQEVARYENPVFGIILEYPATYERVGNFDADGFISFKGEGISVSIYAPDDDTDIVMTEQEYATNILKLPHTEDSGIVTYDKTRGYQTFTKANGKITVDFIAKDLNSFHHFSFSCPEADFSADDPVFLSIMESIRIDDGIYTSLNKMLAEYTILLEYVVSLQYATDADYTNHCLNTFENTNQNERLETAKSTLASIKENLDAVANHVQKENESFGDLWSKISNRAKEMSDDCTRAIAAINEGNIQEAQRISRTSFTYDLSDNAELFLSAIRTEISEY